VDVSGPVDWDEIRELVIESYALNAPKRLAKEVAP
jgi:predicted DNA-binding protein (MmcQ/YjbR family)